MKHHHEIADEQGISGVRIASYRVSSKHNSSTMPPATSPSAPPCGTLQRQQPKPQAQDDFQVRARAKDDFQLKTRTKDDLQLKTRKKPISQISMSRSLDSTTLKSLKNEILSANQKGTDECMCREHIVEIRKRPGQTLGFYIREGNGLDRSDGVFVTRITPGSQFLSPESIQGTSGGNHNNTVACQNSTNAVSSSTLHDNELIFARREEEKDEAKGKQEKVRHYENSSGKGAAGCVNDGRRERIGVLELQLDEHDEHGESACRKRRQKKSGRRENNSPLCNQYSDNNKNSTYKNYRWNYSNNTTPTNSCNYQDKNENSDSCSSTPKNGDEVNKNLSTSLSNSGGLLCPGDEIVCVNGVHLSPGAHTLDDVVLLMSIPRTLQLTLLRRCSRCTRKAVKHQQRLGLAGTKEAPTDTQIRSHSSNSVSSLVSSKDPIFVLRSGSQQPLDENYHTTNNINSDFREDLNNSLSAKYTSPLLERKNQLKLLLDNVSNPQCKEESIFAVREGSVYPVVEGGSSMIRRPPGQQGIIENDSQYIRSVENQYADYVANPASTSSNLSQSNQQSSSRYHLPHANLASNPAGGARRMLDLKRLQLEQQAGEDSNDSGLSSEHSANSRDIGGGALHPQQLYYSGSGLAGSASAPGQWSNQHGNSAYTNSTAITSSSTMSGPPYHPQSQQQNYTNTYNHQVGASYHTQQHPQQSAQPQRVHFAGDFQQPQQQPQQQYYQTQPSLSTPMYVQQTGPAVAAQPQQQPPRGALVYRTPSVAPVSSIRMLQQPSLLPQQTNQIIANNVPHQTQSVTPALYTTGPPPGQPRFSIPSQHQAGSIRGTLLSNAGGGVAKFSQSSAGGLRRLTRGTSFEMPDRHSIPSGGEVVGVVPSASGVYGNVDTPGTGGSNVYYAVQPAAHHRAQHQVFPGYSSDSELTPHYHGSLAAAYGGIARPASSQHYHHPHKRSGASYSSGEEDCQSSPRHAAFNNARRLQQLSLSEDVGLFYPPEARNSKFN